MGTLYVDTIEPQSGTALTVGESGQNTLLAGNDLRANVFKDAGGNAIFTSDGSGSLSGVNSGFGSAMTLISSHSFSSSSGVEITSGFSTTYDEYIFKFYNCHCNGLTAAWGFQCSQDGGSTYAMNVTNTFFRAQQAENNTVYNFLYNNSYDQGNGTGQIIMAYTCEDNSDAGFSGVLHLYNAAQTGLKTCFYLQMQEQSYQGGTYLQCAENIFSNGFFANSNPINAIKFYPNENTADGLIKMFGIK